MESLSSQEEPSTNLELVSSLHVELRQADGVLCSVTKTLFTRHTIAMSALVLLTPSSFRVAPVERLPACAKLM